MPQIYAHHSLLPAITAAEWGVNDGLVVLTLAGARAILAGIQEDAALIPDSEESPEATAQ